MRLKMQNPGLAPRASRNQLVGWFRDSHSPFAPQSQRLPYLIAIHLGEAFLACWDIEERAT